MQQYHISYFINIWDKLFISKYNCLYYGNIKWDDSNLGIDLPIEGKLTISNKDANAQSFKEFVDKHGGLEI